MLLDGWSPGVNGASSGGWAKREDHKEAGGPEICWDHEGSVIPLAMIDMTEEEKEVNTVQDNRCSGKFPLMAFLGLCNFG